MIILIYLMIHFTLFHSTLPAFRNRRANTLPCAHRTLHPKGIGRTPIHDCRPQHFNISVAEEVNNHSTAETCIMGTGPRIGRRHVTTKLQLPPLIFAVNDDAAVPVLVLLYSRYHCIVFCECDLNSTFVVCLYSFILQIPTGILKTIGTSVQTKSK